MIKTSNQGKKLKQVHSTTKKTEKMGKSRKHVTEVDSEINFNMNASCLRQSDPGISGSVETIYKNAIDKRTSSSSEEAMEISGESGDNNVFFAGIGCSPPKSMNSRREPDYAQPSTSGHMNHGEIVKRK